MSRTVDKQVTRNSAVSESVTEKIVELYVDANAKTRWKIVDIDTNGLIVNEPRFYACPSSELANLIIVGGDPDKAQVLWNKTDEIDSLPDLVNGEINEDKAERKGKGWAISL